MRIFRSILALMALMPVMVSCGLTYETLSVQLMKPSLSSLDFKNKTMSAFMVYKNSQDSTICCRAMTSFVEKMSQEYSTPVTLFSLPYDSSAVYSDRDTLAKFITMANTDVLFLACPTSDYDFVTGVMEYKILIYDCLLKEDLVYSMKDIKISALNPSATSDILAVNFCPSWKNANFKILYFDGNSAWTDAMNQAIVGNWTAAVDGWIAILSGATSLNYRMAAEYNIAVGCYLLNDYPLAQKWLEQAITDCGGSVTPSYMEYLMTLIKQGDE